MVSFHNICSFTVVHWSATAFDPQTEVNIYHLCCTMLGTSHGAQSNLDLRHFEARWTLKLFVMFLRLLLSSFGGVAVQPLFSSGTDVIRVCQIHGGCAWSVRCLGGWFGWMIARVHHFPAENCTVVRWSMFSPQVSVVVLLWLIIVWFCELRYVWRWSWYQGGINLHNHITVLTVKNKIVSWGFRGSQVVFLCICVHTGAHLQGLVGTMSARPEILKP